MPNAFLPPTLLADGARGLVKGHGIALCPNDRQASLMAEDAGGAQVASNWAIDRFAETWFTGEDEDNEWWSDMDLHKQFNHALRHKPGGGTSPRGVGRHLAPVSQCREDRTPRHAQRPAAP